MSMLRLSHIALTAFLVSIMLSTSAPAQDLDEIIRTADIGDNLLKSGMGTMVYENEFDTEGPISAYRKLLAENASEVAMTLSMDLSGEYEFAFEDGNYAITHRQIEDMNREVLRVYNGDKLKVLRTDYGQGFHQMGETDYPSPPEGRHLIESGDPRYYTTILGEPVAAFLRRDAIFRREETINAMSCLVFSGTREKFRDMMTVWLAPADLYHRPVRIEQSSSIGKTTHDIEYTSENAVVVPATIIIRHFQANDDITWNLTMKTVITMTGEPQFNIDVPDSLFELVFPPGTGSNM